MSSSSRRWMLLPLVAVIAAVVWMAMTFLDDGGPGDTPTDGADVVVTDMGGSDPDRPAVGVPEPQDVEALVDPARVMVDQSASPRNTGDMLDEPVFVKGWIRPPGEMDLTDLEMTLFDTDGDDVAWGEVTEDGYFEVEYEGMLRSGWGVASSSGDALWRGDWRTVLPAFSGPHETHSSREPPMELELKPGFSPVLTGIVRERATGAPVEDAEISVGSALAAFVIDDDFTDTDENGFYRLELPEIPPNDVLVWCRPWELQAQVLGPLDLHGHDEYSLDFFLDPPQVLRGVVRDVFGEPVSDATVTLGSEWIVFEDDHDWEFTEEDGSFEIATEDIPLEGAWIHVGDTFEYAPGVAYITPPVTGPIEIVVETLGQAIGLIQDAKGEPIQDAEVQIVFYRGWLGLENGIYDEGWTDDEGAFEIDLEMSPAEHSEIVVTADEYQPFTGRLTDVGARIGGQNLWQVVVTLQR